MSKDYRVNGVKVIRDITKHVLDRKPSTLGDDYKLTLEYIIIVLKRMGLDGYPNDGEK